MSPRSGSPGRPRSGGLLSANPERASDKRRRGGRGAWPPRPRLPETAMTPAQKGFQLIELLVVLAVLGSLLTLGVPPLLRGTDDLRLHMAAGEVAGVLRASRSFALRYGANVAVKFN